MEKEKPLPWLVFIGSILLMLSLVFSLVVNEQLTGQVPSVFRMQPLSNVAALILMLVGFILIYTGLRKS
jgi:putative Ca2+/H+ antiporter (TMEM165/GDT1 family)